MTVGGDFMPIAEDEFEGAPEAPTVFGIKFTPAVQGGLIALAGAVGAGALLIYLVLPAFSRVNQLRADAEAKREQLRNSEATRAQVDAKRQEVQDVEQLQADILSLFATEDSLDTLLIDLNERVQSANLNIDDPEQRATLSRFEVVTQEPEVITDSSLGTAVNNNLRRQVYDVAMEGNFAQTQSIIRNIELLQPLLVVREFSSQIDPATQRLELDAQGQLLPNQPVPRLNTTFQLIALIPAELAEPTLAPQEPAEGDAGAGAPAPAEGTEAAQ
jgi:type IV pilus assembly protein PilO